MLITSNGGECSSYGWLLLRLVTQARAQTPAAASNVASSLGRQRITRNSVSDCDTVIPAEVSAPQGKAMPASDGYISFSRPCFVLSVNLFLFIFSWFLPWSRIFLYVAARELRYKSLLFSVLPPEALLCFREHMKVCRLFWTKLWWSCTCTTGGKQRCQADCFFGGFSHRVVKVLDSLMCAVFKLCHRRQAAMTRRLLLWGLFLFVEQGSNSLICEVPKLFSTPPWWSCTCIPQEESRDSQTAAPVEAFSLWWEGSTVADVGVFKFVSSTICWSCTCTPPEENLEAEKAAPLFSNCFWQRLDAIAPGVAGQCVKVKSTSTGGKKRCRECHYCQGKIYSNALADVQRV